jgi:hypothetical protein
MGWNLNDLNPALRRKIVEACNPRQAPKLERAAGHAALGPPQAEAGDTSRVLVRITSVRKRLLDEDNLAEKYHVDCCRYAGLLHSDEPGETKIEVSQRKAEKGEAEETIIEIMYP